MSLVTGPLPSSLDPAERESAIAFVYGPLASFPFCYYCADGLTAYPLVQWFGANGPIFLHPECAEQLGGRLIKDGLIAPKSGRRVLV